MSVQIFVQLPEDVWHAIREFEPFEGFTALAEEIRTKVAEAPKVEVVEPPLGMVRVVVLGSDDIPELVEWLDTAGALTATRRKACQTAIARIREAQRRLCAETRGA